MCLSRVEDGAGNMLTDHVWVHRANKILEEKPQPDERVSLTALVVEYTDQKEGVVKYYLDAPEDVEFPARRGVALRIPEPRVPEPKVEANKPLPANDAISRLFRVKTLADELGGLGILEESLATLKRLSG